MTNDERLAALEKTEAGVRSLQTRGEANDANLREIRVRIERAEGGQPYDERVRLAEIIGDARKLMAKVNGMSTADVGPSEIGELEAMLDMLCGSAERVASDKP
jgi:hypothetical protein